MIETREIGRTRREVTRFGLGGTGLGNLYAAVEDSAAIDLVSAAYAAGVRYFDTAPCYGFGLSEQRLGSAIEGISRDQITVSTKVGYDLIPLGSGEANQSVWEATPRYRSAYDFSYDATMRSVEGSLSRLKLDRIDMIAIHDPDEACGISPTSDPYSRSHFAAAMDGAYRALDEWRSQGVIDAVGVGMHQWQMLVDFARAGDFDYFLLAGRYTLLEQEALSELLPLCMEKNISIVLGGPYNSGILASGATEGSYYNYAPATSEILTRVGRIERVCEAYGISLQSAALQFPLGHPAVACVIPGSRSVDELKGNLSALAEPIPPEFWRALKTERLIREDAPVSPPEAAS